ncbi:MAG: hypothetical protein XXXJIFNMEKO3_02013 [Candidatus Erwinia impunctatus]|nr:hypothetical protein XXXJIFNMEKO_02013 [Culicoides impunctatus]
MKNHQHLGRRWLSVIILFAGSVVFTTQASEHTTLASERAAFKTEIVDTSFQGDGPAAMPPADIFSLIRYPAKDGGMSAFVTPDPKDGKKHPAVIWLIGGYGGIGDDDFFWSKQPEDNDQSGSAFREAGLVMMVPSFRGENDNPGHYEMFYGEIDDLDAARRYLAALPYVDADRIYLAGHSTGGTRVLLASEMLTGFRAAFALGGIPDLQQRIANGSMQVAIPFNQKNPQEFRLRSPGNFITSITSPTYILKVKNITGVSFLYCREQPGKRISLSMFIR